MPCRSRNCWPGNMRSLLWMILVVGVTGCRSSSDDQANETPERMMFAVTSYPLLVMAQQLAGETADVELVTNGSTASPDQRPDSDSIRTMQRATRILISGGDYEPWLQRVTLPRSRLIDTAQGYYDQFVRIPDAVIHQHGPEGGHSHPGVVWATWLDPQLLTSQLDQTRDVLLDVLPDSAAAIRKAADSLAEEFRRLDDRVEEIMAETSDVGITVLGDAPVYQYLTQRLGWGLNYVHLPARGPLSDEDRRSLEKAIAEHQPTVVFVRSTLTDNLSELRGDSEVPFVIIDLCETSDDDRTLVQRMAQNLDAVQATVVP